MKFIWNACINTLPTQDNLKQRNKSACDKCAQCGNRNSTLHTLSGCKVALEQGRYTQRHDNIIKYIANSVNIYKETGFLPILSGTATLQGVH